jgi:hypothetical protein
VTRFSALAFLGLATRLAAQVPDVGGSPTSLLVGPRYESYSLGPGLAFTGISELTVPIVVSHQLGSRLRLDIATAYADASVQASNGENLSLSGFTDTDIRATYALVPGRLALTMVGTLPTGTEAVPDSTLPLFGALATDLFDFTTPSFGTGGAFTTGFAGATQWGENWAVGMGASFRYNAPFTPVTGSGSLKPGDEGRARIGIEGTLPGGKYLRAALVFSMDQHDQLTGGPASATGDRALLYTSLSLPLGRSSLLFYGYDMRRFQPSPFNTTATSVVLVPGGNLFVVGARLERTLSARVSVAPSLEFRDELTEQETGLTGLGDLVRPGVDVRYRVGSTTTLVLQGQYATGALEDDGTSVSLSGPRMGAFLEWAR